MNIRAVYGTPCRSQYFCKRSNVSGIRGTYQITRSLNANVGVSGGSGLYGHVAVTAGMGYEFGG